MCACASGALGLEARAHGIDCPYRRWAVVILDGLLWHTIRRVLQKRIICVGLVSLLHCEVPATLFRGIIHHLLTLVS